MSQVKIKRQFRVVTANIGTGTAASTTLRMDDMAGAIIHLPVVTASGTLQVWGNTTDTGTFTQLFGSDGTASTITVPAGATAVGTSYSFPDAAYGLAYVKLVASSANLTATAASVTLKS